MDVIKSPGSLTKMLAERSSEILRRGKEKEKVASVQSLRRRKLESGNETHVVANDRNERSHPSLKTTVDEGSIVGNRVGSVSACSTETSRIEIESVASSLSPRRLPSRKTKDLKLTSSIHLLPISPKQHHVQIHQIQTLERLVRPAQTDLVQIRAQPSHARRENHDRPRREDVGNNDLGEGTLFVFSDVLSGERDVDEGGRETFEGGGGFRFVVGVDFEGGSHDVLGLGSGELDGVDWRERGEGGGLGRKKRRARRRKEDATTHYVLEKRDLPC